MRLLVILLLSLTTVSCQSSQMLRIEVPAYKVCVPGEWGTGNCHRLGSDKPEMMVKTEYDRFKEISACMHVEDYVDLTHMLDIVCSRFKCVTSTQNDQDL